MLTDEQQTRVDLILERAEAFEQEKVKQGYYLEHDDGTDLGCEYCKACADVVRDEQDKPDEWSVRLLDPSSDHDTLTRCDQCGVDLYGLFTDYAMRQELDWMKQEGFREERGMDCYLWSLCYTAAVEGSDEWDCLMALIAPNTKRGMGQS